MRCLYAWRWTQCVIRWTELIDEVLVCMEVDTVCDQMD